MSEPDQSRPRRIWPTCRRFSTSWAETHQEFWKNHRGVSTCIVWSMCQCRQARAIHQKNLNKTSLPRQRTKFHLNHMHRKNVNFWQDFSPKKKKKKARRCLSAVINSVILRSYGSRFLVISWGSSHATSFMMLHRSAPGIGRSQISIFQDCISIMVMCESASVVPRHIKCQKKTRCRKWVHDKHRDERKSRETARADLVCKLTSITHRSKCILETHRNVF